MGDLVPSTNEVSDHAIPDRQLDERPPEGVNDGSQLSPPIVDPPIHECAVKVRVRGFVSHATVIVYSKGVAVSKPQSFNFSYGDVKLDRPLVVGDSITATQEIWGLKSLHSPSVPVQHQPTSLPKPTLPPPIFDCGRVVPVSGLTPSTHVEVYSDKQTPVPIDPAHLIGTGDCTTARLPVWTTQPLQAGWYVAARQVSCPGTPHELASDPSDPRQVLPEPNPLVAPIIDPPIPHSDVVTVRSLYVGAEITVWDTTANVQIPDGFANADANLCSIYPYTVVLGDTYRPQQQLCTPGPLGPGVVATGQGVTAAGLLSPLCPDTTTVTVFNAIVNAVLVLKMQKPGGPIVIIGVGGAQPGDSPLAIGPVFLPLTLGARLWVEQYIGGAPLAGGTSNSVFVEDCRNVVTQHNDMRRTGAYLHETALSPATVGQTSFGRLYEREVDGSPYAQILYVRGVATPKGTKNLFFVATSTNWVYAFDADNTAPGPNTGLVWQSFLGPTRLLNADEICRETIGTVGVTSTPVIDVTRKVLYVVARHWPGDRTPTPPPNTRLDGDYYLHALNLADGTNHLPPQKVAGNDPVTRHAFDPSCQRNRPGLLLLNGVIYIGFATFSCDGGPYRGWVFGYDSGSFALTGVFCSSEAPLGSGIWQSGNGLVGREDGHIYFETGNDMNTVSTKPDQAPPPARLADSFVRLAVTPNGLQLAGYFQPSHAKRLRDGDRDANGDPINGRWGDTDLGSGGPVLLPDGKLIGGGKQGRYYVLDAQTMGLTQDTTSPDPLKIGQGFQAFVNTYRNVVADRAANFEIYGAAEGFGPNIHGGPCYWPGPSYLYEMPEKDYLKAFFYDRVAGVVQQDPVLTATIRPANGMPGGHSSLSANGDRDGIVWTLFPTSDGQGAPTPGVLFAFDALTLNVLWSDTVPEWFAKFNPPTVASGKVFRPVFAHYHVPSDDSAPTVLGPGKVVVYGLVGARQRERIRQQWWRSGGSSEPLLSIEEKSRRHSGRGALTEPIGAIVDLGDQRHGRRQDYTGVLSGRRTRASVRGSAYAPTFHHPATTPIEAAASIFWTATTGAHIVMGEIREEYLRQGAHEGALGYPLSDEEDTADGRGRVSHFEGGDIVWFADSGAEVRPH